MRNTTLHAILEAFTADAALQLTAETASGAEVPFELTRTDSRRPGRVPLYCYRPLTGAFIRERLGLLAALPTYAPASRSLVEPVGAENYLRLRGETRIPAAGRERADAVLRSFLARVFEERTEFGLDPARFEAAYEQLEHALYEGCGLTTVIAPLLGVALDPRTAELPLGDGLSLMPGGALSEAPAEAVWAAADPDRLSEEANVLAVLTVTEECASRSPVSLARSRFRRLLTALRLFERGDYALGPIAWMQADAGTWRPVPLGAGGQPRFVTSIAATREDELRGFCNLILRRIPKGGEIAWALSRFEMGCERAAPLQGLTDYLLALRALLEPEAPADGRLAQRLAVICAHPEARVSLAERTAHAISLERAVIAGPAPAESASTDSVDALVDELAEHLRALLRDVLCGHLDPDLRTVADQLLGAAAAT